MRWWSMSGFLLTTSKLSLNFPMLAISALEGYELSNTDAAYIKPVRKMTEQVGVADYISTSILTFSWKGVNP